MANKNVFGDEVTGKGSRSKNADYAKNNDNEGNKYYQAAGFVNEEQKNSRSGISTRCVFYNATGETLKTNPIDNDYDGKIFDSYPLEVKNGQWGAFLHVGTKTPCNTDTGSKAYVVYVVKANNEVDFCKSLIGWKTPLNQSPPDTDTHAFCDVFDDAKNINKDEISEEIEKAPKEYGAGPYKGISMTTNIETGPSPLLVVKFLLN